MRAIAGDNHTDQNMADDKKNKTSGMTYRDAGVDIDAADEFLGKIKSMVRKTLTPRVIDKPGGFAGLFSLDFDQKLFARRYRKPTLVACTDGVGTKLKVAFAMKKFDTIGIDLVAMSINDLIVQGAEPLFFLDYIATGKVSKAALVEVMRGITDGCIQAGCALLGGETAEMPGFYADDEFDLAGFAVGVTSRHKIIDGSRVKPGDVVIGIHSSGLHSNGYSLARKVLFEKGGFGYDQKFDELGCSLGEAVLCPTLIYTKVMERIWSEYKVKHVIKAIAHITGGGLVDNIPRVVPKNVDIVIDSESWKVPPLFEIIRRTGEIAPAEMYRVFNMGIGMTLVVPPYYADAIVRRIGQVRQGSYRFRADIIGEVVEGAGVVKFKDRSGKEK